MVMEIKQEEFDEKVKVKCVVDFYATWCPPCKMLAPVIEKVSEEYSNIEFYKVNVDENTDVSFAFNVAHVPTLILFEEGKEVRRASGYMDQDKLKEFIGGE